MNNMLPAFDSGKWESRYQREAIAPRFDVLKENGNTLLKISSGDKDYFFGKWVCKVSGISGGETYSFSVEYRTENTEFELVNAHALFTWLNSKGIQLPRDYADGKAQGNDGWNSFCRTIKAPVGADSLEIELAFWGYRGYEITWRNPVFTRTEALSARKVRLATTLFKPRKTLAENLSAMESVIDKAAKQKADVIVLTEMAYDRMTGLSPEEVCEVIPGKLTNAMAAKARQHNAYIIVNLFEKEKDLIYNTAVLIGRKGEILGKYRKSHLPLYEKEMGITPGNQYPVFETDFGKIGILICMDQEFSEPARILRLKGAEVLFIPTIGYSPVATMAHAYFNGMYVVVSGGDGQVPSRIISPEGKILGKMEQGEEGAVVAEVDLSERINCPWMSVGPGGSEPRTVFTKERRTDIYGFLLND